MKAYKITAGNHANARTLPSTKDGAVLAQIKRGELVQAVQARRGWLAIRHPAGIVWMNHSRAYGMPYPEEDGVDVPLATIQSAAGDWLAIANPGGILWIYGGLAEPVAADFVATAWPTDYKKVTQHFAANKQNYIKYWTGGHEGIDIRAPFGSPYYAIASGAVERVTDQRRDGSKSAYGWHVVINHGDGWRSIYAHAEPRPPVAAGDAVVAGQIIAKSGSTGNSSGPHLHISLKKDGARTPGLPYGYVDPTPYLAPLAPAAFT